jgi:hypothetical protein
MNQCEAIKSHKGFRFSKFGASGRLDSAIRSGAEFYKYSKELFDLWMPHIHTCIHQRDCMHSVFDELQANKDGGTLLTQMDFSEAARHSRNHGPTAEKVDLTTLLVTENSFFCSK